MRLLILSCNTGEGHNSAAKALKDKFAEKGITCEIQDALAYWSQSKSKIISKGHIFIYRNLPKLFGVSYRFEENHPPKDGDDSLIYDLVTKGCKSLYDMLSNTHYDAIICTHVFSSMMITELRRRYNYNVKSYFIATDYTCSPGVNQTMLDKYFIPHDKLSDEFARNNIPLDKLIPSGIPVREEFYTKMPAAKAKAKLGLPANKRIILLMCGSMGCGPIKPLSETLPPLLPDDTMLIIICGNNRKLYKSLTKSELDSKVKVVGFTSRISAYMDAATLILTKPGGLSSTEAAVKALPMIFIDAVPGCETRNIEFLVGNGFADIRESSDELCSLVCNYLDNPEITDAIISKLQNDFPKRSSEQICNFIIKDVLGEYDQLQKIKTK